MLEKGPGRTGSLLVSSLVPVSRAVILQCSFIHVELGPNRVRVLMCVHVCKKEAMWTHFHAHDCRMH